MDIREYAPERDLEAVRRTWLECGWIEKDKEEILDVFIEPQDAWVAVLDGSPECFVSSMGGSIRHLDRDLPLAVVSAVTTSRVARRRGLASRLTAHAVARQALSGAAVSTLGMFDQGYYNNLGFGNGSYEHWFSFQPSRLRVDTRPRVPRRLTPDDAEAMHGSRLARLRGHGACNLDPPAATRAEALWSENGFGLGYFDGPDGELTHHLWFGTKSAEHGPYDVVWMAYRDLDQFMELMGLVRGLGDQVRLVTFREPPGVQIQDLLDRPFEARGVTRRSKFEQRFEALAYWQVRILDLPACLAATRLEAGDVRFHLELTDPIGGFLDADGKWRGIAGDYVVRIGPDSSAEPGRDPALPTLRASVNAFTRLWLGVAPASGLCATDDLDGPDDLIERLDRALRLPRPSPDWDY